MHAKIIGLLSAMAAYPLTVSTILFFGMIIEGDLIIFAAGFLVHRGILDGPLTFAAMYFGVVLGDMLWYRLGLIDTERNKVVSFLARAAHVAGKRLDDHILKRTFRTLLLSKYVYGTHHFILVRAGMLKVPFLKFVRDDAAGSLVWISSIGVLGYLASASFERFLHGLKFVEVGLLVAVAVFFGASELISRSLKKEL